MKHAVLQWRKNSREICTSCVLVVRPTHCWAVPNVALCKVSVLLIRTVATSGLYAVVPGVANRPHRGPYIAFNTQTLFCTARLFFSQVSEGIVQVCLSKTEKQMIQLSRVRCCESYLVPADADPSYCVHFPTWVTYA